MAVKDAISELYLIMRDSGARERDRINAAVGISRVAPLTQPGEMPPEAIVWLRKMVDDFTCPAGYRVEAGRALAYWERRAKKNALQYAVADQDERREAWRKLANGALRAHLAARGRWPQDQHVLLAAADDFEAAACDPDVALSALLLGGQQPKRRRQRAIDERVPGTWSGSDDELRALAAAVHRRLAQFD